MRSYIVTDYHSENKNFYVLKKVPNPISWVYSPSF